MKIPRFASPATISNDLTELPAVSAVSGGGFLVECAPVARFGPAKDARTYLLLAHDQRTAIAREVPDFDNIGTGLPPDYTRQAVLTTNGDLNNTRFFWYNGSHLWVSVDWLLATVAPRIAGHTHKTRLVFALALAAGSMK